VALGAALLLVHRLASADAGYTETVQITGGQLVDSLRSVPFMPKSLKQLFEPTASSKWVHGNQLADVSKSSTEIIDLDLETITRIDNEKKTYTVTTFAQMRQAMKDAPKKLETAEAKMREQTPAAPAGAPPAHPVQVTFEVAVTDPGVSQVINGVPCKKQVLTMKAHSVDPSQGAAPSQPANPSQPADNSVQSITYTLVTDIWTTPEPEEMKEIDDFYQRYGKKLMQGVDAAALFKSMRPAIDGSAIAPLFGNNPAMGSAAQEMMKKTATEMEKIKGTRILEVTRFGGEGMVVPATDGAPASTTAGGAGSSNSAATAAAGQVAADTTSAAVAQQTSKLGAIGSAFGSSVLGAFHHASATPPPAAAPAAPSAAPAANTSAVLYETTTQKTDFSRAPAPATAFQIPGGFTRVESAMPL
jgi:hypothetical protein